jgi:hypothetical protein
MEALMEPDTLKPFKAIRRGDGEHIWGEFTWMAFDPGDWVVAEESDEDEAVWEVFEMRPVLVERRTYRYGKWADDPNREMCEDCGADHLGTGSVCDA